MSLQTGNRMSLLLAVCIAFAGFVATATAAAGADDWPVKPVRIIVPYAPGGATDLLARLVANNVSASLKQSFVVENRAGAGGAIGSEIVAKAVPDGYTLVASGISSHVFSPAAGVDLYDPMKSFTHIALLGGAPAALVVHPSVQAKDVKEFLALARAQPGGLSYGSPGVGTYNHLMGELFRSKTGANLVHVSYKGGGPAVADLVAGHIPAAFLILSTVAPQIKAGKVRALAISSVKRLPEFAGVPTMAQSGYPELTGTTWSGISGPAGMPPAIVTRLNAEIRKALKSADVRERLQSDGNEPDDFDAGAFTEFVRKEINHWTPVVRMAGVKLGK